jgi:hypothetical protein
MILDWCAFLILIWLTGAGLGWVPGPVTTWRRLADASHDRWSDPEPEADDDVTDDVVSPMSPRTVTLRGPLVGPVPLSALRGEVEDQDDEAEQDDADAEFTIEERQAWVRARMRPTDPLGLTAVQIDRRGAELFGCSERTIMRDRQLISGARGRSSRTVGEDQ